MSEHTPGPWKVFITEHPYSLNGRDRKHVERKIGTAEDHPQLHGPYPIVTLASGIGQAVFVKINEADANLIAAAPDLLEAARGIELVYANLMSAMPHVSQEVRDEVTACVKASRVAIAKAEGRS